MIKIRRSEERGLADHGWLRSHHSFSFADYYDPQHMGFRSLRVINEDHIEPGQGFGAHPHRDMEILTYIVSGELEHKDNLGNGRVIRPGQLQTMSAGRGIIHSEFNPSPDTTVHLLQIWILPAQTGLTPRYAEWNPPADADRKTLLLLASPDGAEGSAKIAQDARLYRVKLAAGDTLRHAVTAGRAAWLQVVQGAVTLDGRHVLHHGDAAAITAADAVDIRADQESLVLLFDLK